MATQILENKTKKIYLIILIILFSNFILVRMVMPVFYQTTDLMRYGKISLFIVFISIICSPIFLVYLTKFWHISSSQAIKIYAPTIIIMSIIDVVYMYFYAPHPLSSLPALLLNFGMQTIIPIGIFYWNHRMSGE